MHIICQCVLYVNKYFFLLCFLYPQTHRSVQMPFASKFFYILFIRLIVSLRELSRIGNENYRKFIYVFMLPIKSIMYIKMQVECII